MSSITEQKAIQIVMNYEKSQGREPKDVSKTKCGYDIKSGERCIEVKGQSSKRAGWIWISNSIVRKLGKDLSNYYIYIVYDINNKPKLKILEPDVIFKNLKIDTLFLLTTAVINKHGKDVEL
jgi:hypothetical protein